MASRVENLTQNYLGFLSPYVHWGVRLSVAITYLWHGYHNLPPGGLERRFGTPGGLIMSLIEISGGLALFFGGFTKSIVTRYGALVVVVFMIGAITLVHAAHGWDHRNDGAEFQTLMLMVGLFFLVKGNDT